MLTKARSELGRSLIALALCTVVVTARCLNLLGLDTAQDDYGVDRNSMRYAQQKAHTIANGDEWAWDEE